jgi:thiol-disulfide isomerase/thioredoxin
MTVSLKRLKNGLKNKRGKSMNLRKIILMAIAVLLIGVSSLNAASHKENYIFKFKDLDGNKIVLNTFTQGIHFSSTKGKVILLDFWGNECPPCLMEMPDLIALQKRFKKDFQIISIQVQTRISDDGLRAFAKSKGIDYPIINNSDPEVFKFSDYISAKTGWKGLIPYAIMFDKSGKAMKVYLGLKSKSEYIKDIKSLTNK